MSDKTAEELERELEDTRAALKKANAEAADRRKKLDAIEAAEKERNDKELSETEKLKKLLDEEKAARQALENETKQDKIRTAVLLKATELGFSNPQDAIALTDLSSAEIKEGKVTGFEKALEALAESGRLPVKGKTPGDGKGTPKGAQTKTTEKDKEKPRPRVTF